MPIDPKDAEVDVRVRLCIEVDVTVRVDQPTTKKELRAWLREEDSHSEVIAAILSMLGGSATSLTEVGYYGDDTQIYIEELGIVDTFPNPSAERFEIMEPHLG